VERLACEQSVEQACRMLFRFLDECVKVILASIISRNISIKNVSKNILIYMYQHRTPSTLTQHAAA